MSAETDPEGRNSKVREGETMEYKFGGAMLHRDCCTRNLTDISALCAAALEQICGK